MINERLKFMPKAIFFSLLHESNSGQVGETFTFGRGDQQVAANSANCLRHALWIVGN